MKRYLLVLFFAVMFVGCAHKSASNVLVEQNSNVIINNSELNQKVVVGKFKSKFSSNLLLASVEVKNRSQSVIDLEYKFRWYDGAGFEVSSTPWLPLTLNAMEQRAIQRIATTPRAESFKFFIREKQ